MCPAEESADTLVVRRLLPAPREQVFAAWLDPESLAEWMCLGDIISARVDIDPRVGGKLRIVMVRGEKGVEHWGEYLAIELLERGARTELVLTHRGLPGRNVASHRKGWTDIVRKLEAALTSGPTAG